MQRIGDLGQLQFLKIIEDHDLAELLLQCRESLLDQETVCGLLVGRLFCLQLPAELIVFQRTFPELLKIIPAQISGNRI